MKKNLRIMLAIVSTCSMIFVSACNNDDYTKGPSQQPENTPGNTDTTIKNPSKKDTIVTAAQANKDNSQDTTIKKKQQP